MPFNVLFRYVNFKQNTFFVASSQDNGLVTLQVLEGEFLLLLPLRTGLASKEVTGAYFNFIMSAGISQNLPSPLIHSDVPFLVLYMQCFFFKIQSSP